MRLTIFTPTYNRAYRLPDLYASLCKQSCKDFEWVVVDDGSTDNTEELFKDWIKENKISIKYKRQQNAGKHFAINRGIAIAEGDLFMIVDSDDMLTPDAVDWVLHTAEPLLNDDSFAGLSGIRISPEGKKIGGGEDFGIIDANAIDFRLRYKISGDMAEVFKTSVMKEFPFPEITGEKFCPEALVWNRIALKYNMRFVHHGIYICEYLPDGLTAKITRLRREAPVASMIYYSELYHSDIPFLQKIKASLNFWRFALAPYRNEYRMIDFLNILCYIPGKILALKDAR